MSSGVTRVEGRAAKYHFGEFELCPNQGALWQAGVRVALMPKPLATLLALVERAGETVSKDELLEQVWRVREDTDTRAIDNFMVRLRRYIEDNPAEPVFLETVRGIGYRFEAPK